MGGKRGFAMIGPLLVTSLFTAGLLGVSVTGPSQTDGTVVSGRVVLTAGSVRLVGAPPAAEPVDMSADPYCREQHTSPVMDQSVRVGSTGGIADVLVRVRNAPTDTEPTGADVVLDQTGCLYGPPVVAVRVGQTLTIRNSDATLHNVRVTPEVNRSFNVGQPLRGIESKRTMEEPEIGIPVRCDIHGWMRASIHVLEHSFFDVSADDGSFTLPTLPTGEYEIEAWHPILGAAIQTVTVEAGSPPEIVFEFAAP